MALTLDISIEQLAGALKNLSPSEFSRLKEILEDKWLEEKSENEIKNIKELLELSQEQHKEDKSRYYKNILQEARQKYKM